MARAPRTAPAPEAAPPTTAPSGTAPQPSRAPRTAPPPRRARTAPPEGETARDRFERLGTARMQRAIYLIRLLGNLANGNYNYTNDDVAVMRDTLKGEVDNTLAKFKPKEGRTDKSVVHFRFGRTEADNGNNASAN